MTIDPRRKAQEATRAYRSGHIGQTQDPSVELPVAEKILLEERATLKKLMRKGAEQKDAEHISGKGDQRVRRRLSNRASFYRKESCTAGREMSHVPSG